MTGPPMDIRLHPDATPACAHHARPTPYAFREQVKEQLDDMVANEIIEPVTEPSEWCHPIVIVNKSGTNEKRLTVDFKKLNSQVQRPAHPMTSPRDAVSDIEPSRFFSTLDARHGYTVILQIFGVVLFSAFSVVNGFTEIKKTPKLEKYMERS